MHLKFARSPFQWILYLTAGLLFGSAGLRVLVVYAGSAELSPILGLWLLALLLFLMSESAVVTRLRVGFPLYVIAQTVLLIRMLSMPGYPDFLAVLFAIVCMQIMRRWNTRLGALCIVLFIPLIMFPLARTYGTVNGIAFALLYTFVNVLLASYALAFRRAEAAQGENQALALELEQANRQLETYASRVEQLAIARARHHLARELHDSVTQTLYSMTLSTQSALLLLDRDPTRVGPQLERLNQLAQSAQAEMRALVSQMRPEPIAGEGLVPALERHLASRAIPEGITVSLETDGDQALSAAEEQSLFRIAQEALNNIVKHAQASQACLRLHLCEPFWMEIEDQGCGFDMQHMPNGGAGLSNMRERAAETGWELTVRTAPGAGTRIRVAKRRA